MERCMLRALLFRLYKFYYSTYWYWIVWLAETALMLLPCLERPAFFTNAPPWIALIIEILALSVLLASFLVSLHFQERRQVLREAIHPYIFTVVFLVKYRTRSLPE